MGRRRTEHFQGGPHKSPASAAKEMLDVQRRKTRARGRRRGIQVGPLSHPGPLGTRMGSP